MSALVWSVASLAVGLVLTVVLFSSVAIVVSLVGERRRRILIPSARAPRRELCDHGMWRPCIDCGDAA